MKHKKLLVVLPLLLLTGCATPSMIDANAVAPLWQDVATRHDKLVQESTLSTQEKQIALNSSKELMLVLDAAITK
jgi:hypothetical protein